MAKNSVEIDLSNYGKSREIFFKISKTPANKIQNLQLMQFFGCSCKSEGTEIQLAFKLGQQLAYYMFQGKTYVLRYAFIYLIYPL